MKNELSHSSSTVIYFRPELKEFLRFPLNRNFRWNFVCFFVKPEVLVTQNHAQNFDPKFRLLFPDLIREKLILISDRLVELLFFVLLFWPVWGFNSFLGSKSTTDQAAN
jgi:hypothetical protein